MNFVQNQEHEAQTKKQETWNNKAENIKQQATSYKYQAYSTEGHPRSRHPFQQVENWYS